MRNLYTAGVCCGGKLFRTGSILKIKIRRQYNLITWGVQGVGYISKMISAPNSHLASTLILENPILYDEKRI